MEKNIEKLVHELPDFISGNINDSELKRKIIDEINSNPEFRAEYENMKHTFSFLGETALSDPSPFYFNNLLPDINSRIDALESKTNGIFSGWFANVLKFAIPALIIVIGYFLYTQISGSDNGDEQLTNDKNTGNEMIQEESPGQNKNDLISDADDSTDTNNNAPEVRSETNREVVSNPNTFKTADDGGTDVITFTSENDDELVELITESATYPVISEDSEIELVQEDLTLQEQDELLNYLENAQL